MGMASQVMLDQYYMRMALSLAARGTGCVSPNPRVGCVLVRDGHVVGKGFHQCCGGPHAEVEALVQRKSPSLQIEIERLKKQKLAVKEEIYALLQQALPELELKQQKNYLDLNTLAQMSGVRLQS